MANGYIYGTTPNEFITVRIYWEDLPDTASNSSTVFAKLYYKKSSASNEATRGVIKATLTINGDKHTYNSGDVRVLPTDDKWYYITEHSVVVKHNADGKKSITISAGGGMSGSSFSSTSCSGTAVLTNIPRQANLTSAPSFTDAQNPTIKYSNPAGSAVSGLDACISFSSDGSATPAISYRAVNKTGSSYTFNLTTAEKNTLMNNTSGNSRTVYFHLRTTIGGVKYYSSLAKTFSIDDTSVSFSPVAYDTNSRTTALTGNSSYIIKGYSNLYYDMNTTVSGASTVSSRSAICGGIKKTTETGTFTATQSASITMSATDSRGNSGTTTINKTLINYFKPTIKVDFTPPGADGKMSVSVEGTFYNGSFGKVNNTIACTYGVSQEDSGESYGARFDLKISGNTFSGSVNLEVENYKSVYIIRIGCFDELEELEIDDIRATGTPVYDWGKDDFKFNVNVECARDLTIYGKLYTQNQVLFSSDDGLSMLGTDYAYLTYEDGNSAKISEQTNGVILVFAPKNVDEDWVCHFVPKQLVDFHPGSGHSFQLSNAVYSNIGGKFLFIYDTYIQGWGYNNLSSTGNGITFNSSNWVLRYVIGV